MAKATIKFSTDTKTLKSARSYFALQGVTLEEALSNYVATIAKEYDCSAKAVLTTTLQNKTYKKSELEEFMLRSENERLFTLTENFLEQNISISQMGVLKYLVDELHLTTDQISLVYTQVVRQKKNRNMDEVEAVALENLSAFNDEKRRAERKSAYEIVMGELGKTNGPAPTETSFMDKWLDDFGFTLEVIIEACRRSVVYADKNRFAYTDKILSEWREKKISSVEDIADKAPKRKKQKNNFNDFQQNSYDFDVLEKIMEKN